MRIDLDRQFGRLVGHWDIEQEVRQADGSWLEVSGAEWEFRIALGGCAIQDFWVQPPRHISLEAGQNRQFGTNIRLFDAEDGVWRIVWASSDGPVFSTYEARGNEKGELVMTGPDPDRPGVTQRITYFDISENGWRWKMEFGTDQENWTEVARIQATRR